jgi:competence ComEA-like helix-hairpin-helix protein
MQTLSVVRSTRQISFAFLSFMLILSVSACAKRVRQTPLTSQTKANDQQSTTARQSPQAPNEVTPQRININTASANQLETLPGIGMGLAARIIEHRERYGTFRRPEHLIIVRGISDKRFRALRDLITVD